jgi:hypothetical protein
MTARRFPPPWQVEQIPGGHCQTNLNGPVKGAGLKRSSRHLTPLGQGGRTALLHSRNGVNSQRESLDRS